ncbi:hypothetical protein WN48_05746 [Eufriesea mexicana]|uniref:Uncharacterized protein n=1 Tax=Eufriesea mexicana TaxID=516756 RepID=A0A310SD41_9HYME|nr:hypothetical protein WN48_05746 [Eufriesea mexicana]
MIVIKLASYLFRARWCYCARCTENAFQHDVIISHTCPPVDTNTTQQDRTRDRNEKKETRSRCDERACMEV